MAPWIRFALAVAGCGVALGVVGCLSRGETDVPAAGEGPAPGTRVEVETVAAGLVVPWALAFAPDGRIFVTERPGRIRVIREGRLEADPWAELEVAATGEAGLLGLALSPRFEATGHVYVAGTFVAGDRLVSRVVRLADRDGRGAEPEVILDGIPAFALHAGSALSFGPDGTLYVTTGDARRPELAQRPQSTAGKVLHVLPDGRPAPDNPDPISPVWALGVRNPQGLAWHPASGDLFATDHGPSGAPNEGFRRGDDEVDVIRRNGNYGWPRASGRDHGGFLPPLVLWNAALAPSGLAFYTGSHEPWRGDLFVATLRGEQLQRIELAADPEAPSGWRVEGETALLDEELGRLRAVAMGLDGHLYLTTSNRDGRGSPGAEDDRVLRLVPRPP